MDLVETPIFTKRILELMPDDEYRLLQLHLINKPDAGKIIKDSGGLRKLRWAAKGHGKSGGVRVIYYWFLEKESILLLFAYAKNERDDLTPDQVKQLSRVIQGGRS
ncbi:MAG: type II toxin-antitoxin system RelE/ParE family toxin [Syntrophorhabdaceae bacterium]|nr:type II toxin-antitoxin system RelE/ParE family toxin [Syntrophorhabdaceae bacterium]